MVQLETDYKAKFGLHEHQAKLQEIMCTFDSFCRQKGIEYSIEGGTLLGAIRHGGFIPWDDDADMSITRKDYNKLLSTIASEKHSPVLVENHLWIPRVRLNRDDVGEIEYVDLFIYDRVPASPFMAKFKRLLILMMQGMMHEKPSRNKKQSLFANIMLKVMWVIGRLFPYKTKNRMYQRISQIGKNSKNDMFMIYDDHYKRIAYDNHMMEKDIIDQHIDIPFENVSLRCYKEYDRLLKIHYGDYMKLPPEEMRKPEHLFLKK